MAGGWRNEFQLSDAWSLAADISYSKRRRATRTSSEINAQLGPATPRSCDTGTFQLRGNNSMPSLSFLLDYADPAHGAGRAHDLWLRLHEEAAASRTN